LFPWAVTDVEGFGRFLLAEGVNTAAGGVHREIGAETPTAPTT
jgi:hypothetical protein